ncbi:hypothetical protein B0J11DRAFT_18635 [Dendryphion nanum]|uniref:Uncharacterized protein n=1 Tax=Dendryphion nanum TaxID=256645 RepID=A0A9P9J1C2_9PLEO|nr:hypothetical protein B0J11DRAFT_18635 [Dendryphion nanum]
MLKFLPYLPSLIKPPHGPPPATYILFSLLTSLSLPISAQCHSSKEASITPSTFSSTSYSCSSSAFFASCPKLCCSPPRTASLPPSHIPPSIKHHHHLHTRIHVVLIASKVIYCYYYRCSPRAPIYFRTYTSCSIHHSNLDNPPGPARVALLLFAAPPPHAIFLSPLSLRSARHTPLIAIAIAIAAARRCSLAVPQQALRAPHLLRLQPIIASLLHPAFPLSLLAPPQQRKLLFRRTNLQTVPPNPIAPFPPSPTCALS